MSREITNEIEERRVIRLLAGAAEAVPELHEVELEALLGTAARPCAHRRRGRSFPRRPHLLSAAAVAAVAAVAALTVTLPLREKAPERRSSSPPARVDVHLAAFPEGSALSLLLSRNVEKRA